METSAYILLVLAIGATAAPLDDTHQLLTTPQAKYLPPDSNYLPPEATEIVVETTKTPEFIADEPLIITKSPEAQEQQEEVPLETTVLNDDGYAYKTVHQLRLRYRTRRDVSHLNLTYLPPSQEYLPPFEEDATEQSEAATPKINLDYLPPVVEKQQKLIVAEEEKESEESVASEAPVVETEAAQDTAVLAADGYHYKQPEMPADLSSVIISTPLTREYLPPPVEVDVVVTEEDPAELTDAGYNYGAIKSLRH